MLQKSTTGWYWLSLAQFAAPAMNNPTRLKAFFGGIAAQEPDILMFKGL